MKVKLLKKIRKRYSIYKVDEIESNPDKFMYDSYITFGLPFYLLKDKDDLNSLIFPRTSTFGNFQAAKDKILNYVLCDYKEKFRHKDRKETKIWYLK